MAAERTFTSPAIAEEMERVYGSSVESVKVEMQHEKEVAEFVLRIEEAHKNTSESKLIFR